MIIISITYLGAALCLCPTPVDAALLSLPTAGFLYGRLLGLQAGSRGFIPSTLLGRMGRIILLGNNGGPSPDFPSEGNFPLAGGNFRDVPLDVGETAGLRMRGVGPDDVGEGRGGLRATGLARGRPEGLQPAEEGGGVGEDTGRGIRDLWTITRRKVEFLDITEEITYQGLTRQ